MTSEESLNPNEGILNTRVGSLRRGWAKKILKISSASSISKAQSESGKILISPTPPLVTFSVIRDSVGSPER